MSIEIKSLKVASAYRLQHTVSDWSMIIWQKSVIVWYDSQVSQKYERTTVFFYWFS